MKRSLRVKWWIAVLLLAAACGGGGSGSSATPSADSSGSKLERTAICDRAGDLCGRMTGMLTAMKNAVPNAEYSGPRQLTFNRTERRFILTATIVDPAADAATVKTQIDSVLRSRGWTTDEKSARPLWHGSKLMDGWLLTVDIFDQKPGVKVTVLLLTHKTTV
jgi:hypothetical protein